MCQGLLSFRRHIGKREDPGDEVGDAVGHAVMVLCIVVGCGTKTGNKDGIGMFRIPSVIKNQGEQTAELTTTRRDWWISAINRRDTAY